MPVQEEHYESIPWSHLVEQARPQPWPTYVAAAAIVAVVIGVVVARSSPPPVSVADEPSTSTSSTSTTTSAPLSEQDLLATAAVADDAQAAAMRAEWFVRDYFTVDGAGGRQEALSAALSWSPPAPDQETTTYVEWAQAWSVERTATDRYRVSVAFRSITDGAAGFARSLPRAVAVGVKVGGRGGTRVLDLPEPIELPPAPTTVPPPGPGDVPQPVSDAALDRASTWGDPVSVLEGADTGAGWRVVVTVADEFGTPWPLVVHIDEDPPTTDN